MVTVIITFIISWLVYYILSDKNKFPLYVLTGYIGIILALITDLLISVYPLWIYPGTPLGKFIIYILNAFGLYFVTIYLFLQTSPKNQTTLLVVRHIFIWTAFTITLEFFFISIGFIEHGLWWNIGFSYIADWILFITFYYHHKWRLHVI